MLKNLLAPDKPGEKTYQELIATLQQFDPKPSEIVQRFKFHSRVRAGENVSSYVAELRVRLLAKFCNFRDSLDDMLQIALSVGSMTTQFKRSC